jgi:hypothetical protein
MPLPYGVDDLDPTVVIDAGPPERIRCYYKDCTEFLRPPTRNGFDGDVCDKHEIRCHSSGTYSYQDAAHNVIIDSELFGQKVVGNPNKHESTRLGYEKSEDAVSWNVFRTFQRARRLAAIANELFGISFADEPTLYLWGLQASDDSFALWGLLREARRRFESALPVKRPLTEPDIAFHLPGRYLVLVEAKFTSENPFYKSGPRKDQQSLTLDELRDIYHDPSLRLLNIEKARSRQRIYYQLWRNTVFAEWMARQDSPETKAYQINLVRSHFEEASAAEFHGLISDGSKARFRRVTWEDIYGLASRSGAPFQRLCRYMETKTANLRKVFRASEKPTSEASGENK